MLNVKPHHFVIFILAAPYEKQSAYSAYHFAKALLAKGHFLDAVFFYSDGVMVANPLLSSEQNNLFELWQALAKKNAIPLHVCLTEAKVRGFGDEAFTNENNTKISGFLFSGIAQFFEALKKTDRVVTFGLK